MKKQTALFAVLLVAAFAVGLLIPTGQGSTVVAENCITGTCYIHHAAGGPCASKYTPWQEVWTKHTSSSYTCCGTHLRDECLDEVMEPDPGPGGEGM